MSFGNENSFPKVSVVIPTYNHSAFICDAIESVLIQEYPNKEIIVVDDGSTDDTRSVVAKYSNLGLKFIHKSNGGLSSARNAGISNATGTLIAFLDADDVWLENKLSLQFESMLDKKLDLVGCGFYWVDRELHVVQTVCAIKFKSRESLLSSLLIDNVIWGSGSGVLLKKECFSRVGLFDESLSGAEDWDMWLRISKHYDIGFVKAPLVKIRLLNNSMSSPSNANNMLKNEIKILTKHFSDNQSKAAKLALAKALSFRFFKAAIAFKEVNNRKATALHCLKAFFMFPPVFLNKSFLAILLWIILGRKLFSKLTNYRKPNG